MLLLREQGPGCGVEMVQLPRPGTVPCLPRCGSLVLLLLLQPPIPRHAGLPRQHWRRTGVRCLLSEHFFLASLPPIVMAAATGSSREFKPACPDPPPSAAPGGDRRVGRGS